MAGHRALIAPARFATAVTTGQGIHRIRGAAGESGQILTPAGTMRLTFADIALSTSCLNLACSGFIENMKSTGSPTWGGTVDVPLASTDNNCSGVDLVGTGPAMPYAIGGGCGTPATVSSITLGLGGYNNFGGAYPYQVQILLWYNVFFLKGPIWFEALVDLCDLQEGAAIPNRITTGGVCYTLGDGSGASFHALGSGGTCALTYLPEC